MSEVSFCICTWNRFGPTRGASQKLSNPRPSPPTRHPSGFPRATNIKAGTRSRLPAPQITEECSAHAERAAPDREVTRAAPLLVGTAQALL